MIFWFQQKLELKNEKRKLKERLKHVGQNEKVTKGAGVLAGRLIKGLLNKRGDFKDGDAGFAESRKRNYRIETSESTEKNEALKFDWKQTKNKVKYLGNSTQPKDPDQEMGTKPEKKNSQVNDDREKKVKKKHEKRQDEEKVNRKDSKKEKKSKRIESSNDIRKKKKKKKSKSSKHLRKKLKKNSKKERKTFTKKASKASEDYSCSEGEVRLPKKSNK